MKNQNPFTVWAEEEAKKKFVKFYPIEVNGKPMVVTKGLLGQLLDEIIEANEQEGIFPVVMMPYIKEEI
jgi:hypothetical protein